MKRSGIGPGALSRERGSTFKAPDPAAPPKRRRPRNAKQQRKALRRWRTAFSTRCEHPKCEGDCGRLELHHVVYAQHVRAADGDVFDPRNGFTAGRICHRAHHARVRVIPLTALPAAALVFAVELLGAPAAYEYLKRRYSGRDERLERMLYEGSPHPS